MRIWGFLLLLLLIIIIIIIISIILFYFLENWLHCPCGNLGLERIAHMATKSRIMLQKLLMNISKCWDFRFSNFEIWQVGKILIWMLRFEILWGSQTCNHPHKDLTKFGYRPNMNFFLNLRILLYFGYLLGTCCRNLPFLITFFFFFQKLANYGYFFSQKIHYMCLKSC